MAKGGEHLDRVELPSLEAWRDWLRLNHRQSESIWAVTYKKDRGPYLAYADVRDEALCWGWIDSLRRRVDETRTRLLMSPRRAGSSWSAVNKSRIAALTLEGRMQAAGLAAIEAAKQDGSWTRLDEVETLSEPQDLLSALRDQGSLDTWKAFSPSSRRGILEWISTAKREETREKRVSETARLAAMGLRANFPESKGK